MAGSGQPQPRLFDAATPARVRKDRLTGAVGATVLCGGLAYLLYLALPSPGFWRTILLVPLCLVAVVALSSAGDAFVLLLGAPPPEVTCTACGAAGWTVDLATSGGTCPHCGSGRFRAKGKWVKKRGAPGLNIVPNETDHADGTVSGEALATGLFRVTHGGGADGGDDGDGDGDRDGGGDGGD